MSVPICTPCLGIDCFQNNPLDAGIDGALYSQLDYSFEVFCPAGCVCSDGLFPRTISILASVIPPVVPPIAEPGSPIILRLQGCTSLITRTLASGSTQAEIVAAAQSMQGEWSGQQSLCIARATPGVNCNTGDTISVCNDAINDTCPYNGNPIVVAAGILCQSLVTTGLTQAQIDAATAVIKTNLNINAKATSCPFGNGLLCNSTRSIITADQHALILSNGSNKVFDSSSFQVFNNQTNALLQTSLHATIAPNAVNIVVLSQAGPPGFCPQGVFFAYLGSNFFTWPHALDAGGIQMVLVVACDV